MTNLLTDISVMALPFLVSSLYISAQVTAAENHRHIRYQNSNTATPYAGNGYAMEYLHCQQDLSWKNHTAGYATVNGFPKPGLLSG